MLRKAVFSLGLAALLAAVLVAQEGAKKKGPTLPAPVAEKSPPAVGEAEAIATASASYAAAFNKNDAAALAAHWAEKGVYVDRETGERTEGRAALLADFQRLFKEQAGARLAINLTGTRLVRPDVALVEGQTTAFLPGRDPSTNIFSAIYVKQGDKWLIDSVQESPLPTPPSARDALQELDWLVGHWVDESESTKVDTTARWSNGDSFLVRAFLVQRPGEEEQQGSQVIGWDPRTKQIRSWSFFSDGSFGEGLWSRSGDEWLVKGTHTLADGRLAAGTQVIQRQGDGALVTQIIGREIDGEPVPSSERVRVLRVPSSGDRSSVGVPPTGTGVTTPAATKAEGGSR